jgi:hypothetical protein
MIGKSFILNCFQSFTILCFSFIHSISPLAGLLMIMVVVVEGLGKDDLMPELASGPPR